MAGRSTKRWSGAACVAVLLAGGTGAPAQAQAPAGATTSVQVLGTDLSFTVQAGPAQPAPQPPPPGGERPSSAPAAPVPAAKRVSFDDKVADVARVVPDFGGMFLADDGQTLVVRMQGGLARATAARGGDAPPIQEAVGALARRFGIEAGRVQVARADFDFRQLDGWHDRLRPLLGIPGVTGTDADERRNRVVVMASTDAARRLVRQRLDRLGVPAEAVRVVEGRPAASEATLRDRRRSMLGGLTISPASGGFCTLGIYGYSWRLARWGMLTNSHCTDQIGRVEGTRFFQDKPSGRTFQGQPGTDVNDVGTEVLDAPLNGRDWSPAAMQADVAFIALPAWMDPDRRAAPNNTWQSWDGVWTHGAVALPDAMGSLEYNGFSVTNPNGHPDGARWIVRVNRWPLTGLGVQKVGRRTGRTGGKITHTCTNQVLNTDTPAPDYTVTCASATNYVSDSGDSGSPVFYGGGPNGEAYLTGLHFGGSPGFKLFSPIGEVEKVTGPLFLCRFGFEQAGC